MRMENCPLNVEVISDPNKICPRGLLGVEGGLQRLSTACFGEQPHALPSHLGLKTLMSFLQLFLCVCPFPSSWLNHFQVLSILFQHYLLLLSSFFHPYCHFTISCPARSHTNEFYKHLLEVPVLCCM